VLLIALTRKKGLADIRTCLKTSNDDQRFLERRVSKEIQAINLKEEPKQGVWHIKEYARSKLDYPVYLLSSEHL